MNCLKTALLGTDRSEFSSLLQQQLEELGVDPALSEAEALLEATVLVSRMRRAGKILTRMASRTLPGIALKGQ